MRTDARLHEMDFYFVVQRIHTTGEGERTWIDSSSGYYGEHGEAAAVDARDHLREIFGKDEVRAVRRDITIVETTVKD